MYARGRFFKESRSGFLAQLFWIAPEHWPHLDQEGNFILLAGTRTTTAHSTREAAEEFAKLRGLPIQKWTTV